MTITLKSVFLLAAIVCEVLHAVGLGGRVNLMVLGFAFFMAYVGAP